MPPPAGNDADRDSEPDLEARVRERFDREHAPFLAAVERAGRETARTWTAEPGQGTDGDESRTSTPARAAVVDPFESALRDAGALERAPNALATAADAAGGTLQAEPVPAPPYVVVTARGVLLRATTDVGRIVVTIAPFTVRRDPVRYEHREVDGAELVHVERRT